MISRNFEANNSTTAGENKRQILVVQGLPSSGKSHIAELAAKTLGFCMFDPGAVIREEAGFEPGEQLARTQMNQAIDVLNRKDPQWLLTAMKDHISLNEKTVFAGIRKTENVREIQRYAEKIGALVLVVALRVDSQIRFGRAQSNPDKKCPDDIADFLEVEAAENDPNNALNPAKLDTLPAMELGEDYALGVYSANDPMCDLAQREKAFAAKIISDVALKFGS